MENTEFNPVNIANAFKGAMLNELEIVILTAMMRKNAESFAVRNKERDKGGADLHAAERQRGYMQVRNAKRRAERSSLRSIGA